MGKRKLAATISGVDHSSEKSCYSSQGIVAHLRGWDHGIKVYMEIDENDVITFQVYETGGSHNPSTFGKYPMFEYNTEVGQTV